MARPPLPAPWLFAALTVLYFVAGKAGLAFATLNSSASAVWPPTGIALGAFLLFGTRVWPAIFAGAFLVNVTTAGTAFTSASIAAGNTLEGLVGSLLVIRFAGGRACFERAPDVFRFALAAMVATTISATVGVTTLGLGGFAKWQDFEAIWLTWWLGDVSGALVVTPLMILWHPASKSRLPGDRVPEAGLMMLAVVAVAAACFVAPGLRNYPLVFLCLPPLAWIALRFGSREVATAIVLVSAIAVAATEKGLGPFVMRSHNESLLVLQAFMGMVAMTLLPMAAIVRQHRFAVVEAEAATKSRDVFLAMLSHELRNPLQAITTSLQLLSVPGVSHDNVERAVMIARRQSDHLARLVSDLLDVTRAVSGKMAIELRRVRLDEAAARYVELVTSLGRMEDRKVNVEVEPVTILADPVRLEQILGNLLTNAVKFTAPAGVIRVAVLEEDGQAVLRVQDDGVGIAPELLPRVFEPFTQGKRRLNRSRGGLGVGLTLVRTLAELHGGEVQARSAGIGEGSEFVVRFPIVEDEPGPSQRRPSATGAGMTTQSILIIEDNVDARETLREVLALDGHDVHEAGDGEEGIAVAQRVRPDTILVDIGLPGIDGYEVAAAVAIERGIPRRALAAHRAHGLRQPEDVRPRSRGRVRQPSREARPSAGARGGARGAGCARGGAGGDDGMSDEQEIRDLVSRWMAETRAGNTPAVLELMTDDVVFLRPGHPPMRKAEFAEVPARSRAARRRPSMGRARSRRSR
jgi:signal transduction histidine kinase